MAVVLNKNSFCLRLQLTPFSTKTNLRENRLFAARWAVGGEKGSHSVKNYTEKRTKDKAPTDGLMGLQAFGN